MADRPVRYKVYTAPPRKLKKRRTKTGKPFTLFISILGICTLLFLAWLAVAKLSKPYLISHSESKQIEVIEKNINTLDAENESLRKEIKYLKSQRGVEVEARKLGWVKDGEVAVVVEKRSRTEKEWPAAPQQKESRWKSFWGRIAGAFK